MPITSRNLERNSASRQTMLSTLSIQVLSLAFLVLLLHPSKRPIRFAGPQCAFTCSPACQHTCSDNEVEYCSEAAVRRRRQWRINNLPLRASIQWRSPSLAPFARTSAGPHSDLRYGARPLGAEKFQTSEACVSDHLLQKMPSRIPACRGKAGQTPT